MEVYITLMKGTSQEVNNLMRTQKKTLIYNMYTHKLCTVTPVPKSLPLEENILFSLAGIRLGSEFRSGDGTCYGHDVLAIKIGTGLVPIFLVVPVPGIGRGGGAKLLLLDGCKTLLKVRYCA